MSKGFWESGLQAKSKTKRSYTGGDGVSRKGKVKAEGTACAKSWEDEAKCVQEAEVIMGYAG